MFNPCIATQIKFTRNAGEAFIEAHFAGCFRVLTQLSIKQYHMVPTAAQKIANIFKDSPKIEV